MPRGKTRALAAIALTGALGIALTACVAPSDTNKTAASSYKLSADKVPADANAPVVVWADAVRKPGLEAFQKAHPEVKLDIQLVPLDQMLAKIQLANRAGSGWPDVVWVGDGSAPSLAAKQYDHFLQPLDGLIDDATLKNFGTSNVGCNINGEVVCLRNDIAPDVMYYNTKGFEEIGAKVPTTFEELGELVDNLAKNHPDYKIQLHGSDYRGYMHYYQASQCPYLALDGDKLTVNVTDPRCVRAFNLIDKLVSSKALVTNALSADQLKAMGSKMLLSINGVWRASLLGDLLGYAPGTLGVAKVPVWQGDEKNSGVGNEGGGAWGVSRYAKNMKGAIEVAKFMSTDTDWLNSTITFPAYEPAQQAWLDLNLPKIPALADPKAAAAVFVDSAKRQTTNVPWVRFNSVAEFPVADVQAGKKVASEVSQTWATRLINVGSANGYTVDVAK